MSMNVLIRGRLPAIATACLLSAALPTTVGMAKDKVKSGGDSPAALEMDYSVSIPTVDANGSNLDNAVITEILRGNIAENADALANLDATSIAVPEITLSVSSQSNDQTHDATVTLTDLLLENVVDGKAAGISLAGVTVVADDANFAFGAMSAANLDIAGILGIYGLVDIADRTGLETIYTDLVSEGGTLESEDVSCSFGGVTGAEFKARPLNTPLVEMMAVGQAMEDQGDDVDPATMGRFLKIYADILTAFETSEVSFEGFDCSGVDEDGRPMTFSVAGMTMGGMSPGIYPSLAMDGLDIVVEGDGSFSLDNLTIKPMDLTSTIAALEGAPAEVDEAWLEENARALIPAMEGLSLSGLDIDIPEPDTEGARIQAKLGAFDVSLARYVNGIPTDLDVSATNLQAAIPEGTGEDGLEQMLALGITDVDVGFRVAAAWDADSQTVAIEEMSLTGADLATVLIAGTLANATEDLFALDMSAAMAASMAVAVKNLDLTVTDAGLSDVILAVVAAEQGADPATLRPVFAGLAQGSVIGMMAGAADAAKLGEAINSFVAGNAKTLMIGLEAKSAPGLGMMDFMQAEEDPTSLIGKVNISAEAK
ncbi:hypothetical protein GGR20_001023 [Devosia subaequoris]|uniref:Uncharacterized protein n=1 Tax=Devosia subaequoris TaxID=395930 RepID=A0A7W6NAX6_9HYPH|nr:hypothetical protein [Devosia subaequoris]MBB4051387.1 hypothetical protein [Devosia subaequoris]MCP1208981.1 hypothetical protein [Devosia subaequoris]